MHVKLRRRHIDKPGLNLMTQNGSTPNFGDLLDFGDYREGVSALLRAILRRGVRVDSLRAGRGWGDGREVSCHLYFNNERIGSLDIETNRFGVDVKLRADHNGISMAHKKSWKKEMTIKRINGYRPFKTRNRPKLKKFGAYAVSQLLKYRGERIADKIMES